MFDISQEEDYRELTLEEQYLVNGGDKVENSDQGVAGASAGDFIIRDDGTKVTLKQIDIDLAAQKVNGNGAGGNSGNSGNSGSSNNNPSTNTPLTDAERMEEERLTRERAKGYKDNTKYSTGKDCYDPNSPDPDRRYNGRNVNGKHLMLINFQDADRFADLRDYYLAIGKYGSAGTTPFDGIGLVNDEGQVIHILREEKSVLNYSKSLGLPTDGLHGDVFFTAEVELVAGIGFEASISFVLDLDNWKESGFNFSFGFEGGCNVGCGVGGGYVCREFEGAMPVGIDGNLGAFSPSVMTDEQGFNGLSVTFGPGMGLSSSSQKSYTLTFNNIYNFIKGN